MTNHDGDPTPADRLREYFPAGSTVSTMTLHVSQSGMTRAIAVLAAVDGEVLNVSGWVALALGWKLHRAHMAVTVKGCGMDMAYHLVHTLAQVLHADGYALNHRSIG